MISTLFRLGIVEQLLLGRRALPAQPAALADGERHAQFGFHQPGQREIQVVAAQQQVLAHGGAREVDQVALARDADQAEIAGAAAHVADQHDLAVEELLARLRQVVGDPRIERRGRLFEQREPLQAGIARGHHGEFARLFVERRRDGEHDVLLGQRRAVVRLVPLLAELADEARRNFHRREHAPGLLRIPRQDLGGAIHIGVGEPGFRRVHQARGHDRALLARVDADRLAVFQEQERGQRAARLDAAGGHQLRRLEDVDRREIAVSGLAFVDVGQRGVGGAEVDADFHAGAYSISISAGAMMMASSRRVERADSPWPRAIPCGAQAAVGRRGGDVADEADHRGVPGGRLGGGAFDAIDHRLQCDHASQGVAALAVMLAHGGADLVVGVSGDIFHQEVDQAALAL